MDPWTDTRVSGYHSLWLQQSVNLLLAQDLSKQAAHLCRIIFEDAAANNGIGGSVFSIHIGNLIEPCTAARPVPDDTTAPGTSQLRATRPHGSQEGPQTAPSQLSCPRTIILGDGFA